MPLYEFYCGVPYCRKRVEEIQSFEQVGKIFPLCPKHYVPMLRLYSVPHLANMIGGVSVSENVLLSKKQESRKTRSRAHFKNEVMHKIKDPGERRHFEKKFKGTKKIDHEKL